MSRCSVGTEIPPRYFRAAGDFKAPVGACISVRVVSFDFVWLPIQIVVRFSWSRKMSRLPSFLASALGVSVRTVERWCEAGKVPGVYRTRGGHWRSRGRLKIPWKLNKKLAAAIMGWRPPVEEMEELTASQEFNDALEFSLVAKEISHDDMRDPMGLKHRDPEKFSSLIGERDPKTGRIRPTPMRELIHERAYDERNGILKVKAEKLRLNMREPTPASLAAELKISVATLYRRYREAVKDVCAKKRLILFAGYTAQPISDNPFFCDFGAMLADYEPYRRFDDIGKGTSITR
jgi:hypothetical protein